ncbi:MAG: monothiol glutaredoxin, Grx4 family [Myxococcales bacterium]|nr:monothiol glutaredoxin, Grx4 family [Myxococcales bacterium]
MKGTRRAPECGFSSSVVDILDDYLDEYATVNVLRDPEVREGIKAFSDWPTIPQLYVRGSFVGGADIIKELQRNGELAGVLGAETRAVTSPELLVTEEAIAALERFAEGGEKPCVRLSVDRSFHNDLSFDVPSDGDFVLDHARFTLLVDRATARRADGAIIAWLETPEGGGFKIENPNAPPTVRPLAPRDLKKMLDAGKPIEIFDVREPEEMEVAPFAGARPLDAAGRAHLDALSRDVPVVFVCHHGIRSAGAAEHCLRAGFREVSNLTGGIDAWSRDVDPSVPRY